MDVGLPDVRIDGGRGAGRRERQLIGEGPGNPEGRRRLGNPLGQTRELVDQLRGGREARVGVDRVADDSQGLFVDEGHGVAAADRGLAILERIPGDSEGRAEVVAVRVVGVALEEVERRVGGEQRRLDIPGQYREKAEVVVLAHRAEVLPLHAVTDGQVRAEAPVVLEVEGPVVEREIPLVRNARNETGGLVPNLEGLRH